MTDTTRKSTFWGKDIRAWMDIYAILRFRGSEPGCLKDLLAFEFPDTPQGCADLTFAVLCSKLPKVDRKGGRKPLSGLWISASARA